MKNSNLIEFFRNGKSCDRYAVTDVAMLHYMMQSKVQDGTVFYGNESELSEKFLKQDIDNNNVNYDLFKFDKTSNIHDMVMNTKIISFSDLANIHEIVSKPNIEDILEYMKEEDISYFVSEVEIRSNENYFNGFIPMVMTLKDFQNTDTYKSFMEQENTGTINISIYNNSIGNGVRHEFPTNQQAQQLFNQMDEVEKMFEIETLGHTFNTMLEEEYANDFER